MIASSVTLSQSALLLLARVCASMIFVIQGFNKLTHMEATVAGFTKLAVPQPQLAYYIAVAVEMGCGLLLMFGLKARFAAMALAVFCLATAMLAHSDFTNMGQQVQFLKNLSMTGGFLAFVVTGAGFFSVDTKIDSIPKE